MISRVEVVLEKKKNDIENSRPTGPPSTNRSDSNRTIVETCHSGRQKCIRGGRPVRLRHLEGISHTYDVFDVTRSFASWWAACVDDIANRSHVVEVHLDQVLSKTADRSLNYDDILLIVYRNISPNVKRSLKKGINAFTSSLPPNDGRSRRNAGRFGGRRSATERQSVTSDGFCSLRHWFLSFDDLGWAWIIAPRGFDANFCTGSCQVESDDNTQVNLTNNAFLRVAYRAAVALGGTAAGSIPFNHHVPGPCCVPAIYRPVSVLYKANNETFVMRNVNEMIAKECGCL